MSRPEKKGHIFLVSNEVRILPRKAIWSWNLCLLPAYQDASTWDHSFSYEQVHCYSDPLDCVSTISMHIFFPTQKVAPSVQLFQQCRGHTELTTQCPYWSSIYPSSPGLLLFYLNFIVKKLNHRMLSHSTGNNNHKETSMGLGVKRLHMQWERVESLEQTFLYHGLKTENCFSFVYLFRAQERDMYNQGRQKRYQKKSVSTILKIEMEVEGKTIL